MNKFQNDFEMRFICSVDNERTFGFSATDDIEYADIASGEESFKWSFELQMVGTL